jgi:hypothetical protein
MARPIPDAVKSAIRLAISECKDDFHAIARLHGVHYGSVSKIYHQLKANKWDAKPKLYFSNKNEAYQTEEEMLKGIPQYTCKNKHLITPIREDWKLY